MLSLIVVNFLTLLCIVKVLSCLKIEPHCQVISIICANKLFSTKFKPCAILGFINLMTLLYGVKNTSKGILVT